MSDTETYAERMLKNWLNEHKLQFSKMKQAPAFDRNLEKALDKSRTEFGLMTAKPRWDNSVIDWTSSDFLSLSRSGRIREAVNEELDRQGEYLLSASGSRAQFGNYDYLLDVEREIARFHNAETAWIAHSGFFACVGAIEAVLLPGDAIVYDEFMHASTHVGMRVSSAAHKSSFRHNNPDSLRDVLTSLKDTYPAFRLGTQSILICVESIYSMDGDICPLKECVEIVNELFPLGNAQLLMDEAHSSGVLGPKGAGLVQMLGLEKDIAIRIHMCSKALGSTGGQSHHAYPHLMISLNENYRCDSLQQDGPTCHHASVTLSDLFRSSVHVDGRVYPLWLCNIGEWGNCKGMKIAPSASLRRLRSTFSPLGPRSHSDYCQILLPQTD